MFKTDFCINHRERHANGTCLYCGNSICDICISENGGPFCCPACKEALSFAPPAALKKQAKKRKYVCLWDICLFMGLKVLPSIAFFVVIAVFVFGYFSPKGKEKWRTPLSVSNPNPVIILDGLIITSDELSTIAAWDTKSGKKIWNIVSPTQGQIISARKIDEKSFLYATTNTVYKVEIITGNFHKHLWETNISTQADLQIQAADKDNAIILKHSSGGLQEKTDIFCIDTHNGSIRWQTYTAAVVEQCLAAQNYLILIGSHLDTKKIICINRITGKTEWTQTVRSNSMYTFTDGNTAVVATDRRIADINVSGIVNSVYKTSNLLKMAANREFIVFQDVNGMLNMIDRQETKQIWQHFFGTITSDIYLNGRNLYFTVDRNNTDMTGPTQKPMTFPIIRSPLNLKSQDELVPMLVCVDTISGNINWICEHTAGTIDFDFADNIMLSGNYKDFAPLITQTLNSAFFMSIDQASGEIIQQREFQDEQIYQCTKDSDAFYIFLNPEEDSEAKEEKSDNLELVAINKRLVLFKPAFKWIHKAKEKINEVIDPKN